MIQHRAELIQRVTTVMAIVDSLGDKVHPELYVGIQAEKTSMEQMRRLYTKVLTPGGRAVREAFYDALKKHQPHLLKSLGKIRCIKMYIVSAKGGRLYFSFDRGSLQNVLI